MRDLLSRATLLLVVSLLAACAGLQPDATPPTDWDGHHSRLAALDHWTASGKLALRTPQQAESANLLWQQAGDFSHLRLSGPLGVSATTISSDGRKVEVRQGDEQRSWPLSGPDSLSMRTGWDLPLDALPHWLKGIPAPQLAVEAMTLGEGQVTLQQLKQAGWTVQYQDYASFQGLLLPTRLLASRDDTSLRLVLREWRDLVE